MTSQFVTGPGADQAPGGDAPGTWYASTAAPSTAAPSTDRPRPTSPADPAPATAGEPSWTRPALIALLLGTAVAYLVNLSANGWANSFYSAAAQAGSQSWQAFFYGSLDAANAITVDKPPASLWVMGLSVRLFGLNSWSILVPQVLMGVASVGVVYATVRRAVGARAGLLAGLVLALTPVAALMFRFNNPDALLTLLMTLAAWATLRAVETPRYAVALRWMALAGALLGVGFLTKTLQVLLVVPALGLAWLIAARTSLGRRVVGGLVGIAVMMVTGGWWVAIVELVPESMRPYIGGSQTNSFWELTFGYNGLGRLNGEETGSVVGGRAAGGSQWGETGLFRLFDASNGGQISWLIPSALVLLVGGLLLRRGAPRTDPRRAGYIVWGGWLLVTMATFSFMAGIFHDYYSVALAPAVAALIGLGAADAWQNRTTWLGRGALAGATVLAGIWGYVLLHRTTQYPAVLGQAVLVVGVVAGLGLLAVHSLKPAIAAGLAAASIAAGLAGPAAYTVTTISEAHSGSIVTAGPSTGSGPGGRAPGGVAPGRPGQQTLPNQQQDGQNGFAPPDGTASGPQDGVDGGRRGQDGTQDGGQAGGGPGGLLDAAAPSDEAVAALTQDADAYTWIAAAVGSQSAAGVQLATELPVMAIGGFNGSDPSPTLEQFQTYVAEGEIHYFVAGGGRGGGGGGGQQQGGSQAASEISAWVQENFTAVTIGETTMYDLTQPSGSSLSSTTDAVLGV